MLAVMFALGYVPYHWYRRAGFAKYLDLRAELAELQGGNRALQAENDRMAREVARLSDDPRAIEYVARHELGWARPGDIVVEVSAAAPPATIAPSGGVTP